MSVKEYDGWEWLTLVPSTAQANMIEGLLESAGIGVYRGLRGAGSYMQAYAGSTVFGVDIYVPADRLGEARELMEAYWEGNPEAQPEETGDIPAGGKEYEPPAVPGSRKLARCLIGACAVCMLLAFLISSIGMIVRYFTNMR